MKIAMVVVKLLFLGAMFLVSNYHLSLADQADRDTFVELYEDWLTGLLKQAADVTSYVVQVQWLPSNNNTIDLER